MNDPRPADGAGLRMRSHCVHMDDRSTLSVTGVTDIGCFNEREVQMATEAGGMTIEGTGLHITKLDLDSGQVMLEGEIDAIVYEEDIPQRKASFLSRVFR